MRQVGHKIFDDRHMRQRVDRHFLFAAFINGLGAGQCVAAVDVHGAGTADAFAAGTAEGQGRVDFVLDLDQRIQHHRAALIKVDFVGVDARIGGIIRIPAVNLEATQVLSAGFGREMRALGDFRVCRQGKFSHDCVSPQYLRSFGGM